MRAPARAAENEELRLLREQLASSSRHEDAMLESQREQSGRMEKMVLQMEQMQLQITTALAERSQRLLAESSPRARREVAAAAPKRDRSSLEADEDLELLRIMARARANGNPYSPCRAA